MAGSPAIVTLGLRELQRDLKVMMPGTALELRLVVKSALEPMRRVAVSQSPGSHRTIGSRWRASMRGANGALTNTHPGVRPHEFGGIIRPRGAPITIEATHMIYGPGGAMEEGKDETEKGLLAGFERLARSNGWA